MVCMAADTQSQGQPNYRTVAPMCLESSCAKDYVLYCSYTITKTCNTVEPPKKGHFGKGTSVLSSEVVLISEVHEIF